MTIQASAPGKLFIAGEYAVVEPGQHAVLVAVDRFITITLTPSTDTGRIHSAEYGRLPVEWRRDETGQVVAQDHPYDYVMSALSTVERLREERGIAPSYFDLHIESELDDAEGQKFGLGSSAAVVVATLAAINSFYDLGLSTMDRFKLAMLATIAVSPRASGGDLASSTYGGWINYSSPNRETLREYAASHTVTESLSGPGWDECEIEVIPAPSNIRLLVGWTGSPASTSALVGSVKKASPKDSPDYGTFLSRAADTVKKLTDALKADDFAASGQQLNEMRQCLLFLQESSGIVIETDTLTALCEIAGRFDAPAKPAGAGGGDCGIAFANADTDVTAIWQEWEQAGIRPLDLAVYSKGDA